MKRHITWSMLIALGIILGLVGLATAQQPRYGGTLRVAWEQDVTGFDHTGPRVCRTSILQEPLQRVMTVDEHLNYVPDLAESWEVQDNGQGVCVPAAQGGQVPTTAPTWTPPPWPGTSERIMDPEEKALTRPYLEVIEAVESPTRIPSNSPWKYPTQTFLPAGRSTRGLS